MNQPRASRRLAAPASPATTVAVAIALLLLGSGAAWADTVWWTGATSTDWANSGNWTNAGGTAALPGPGTNVVIDGGTAHPTLDFNDAGLGGVPVTIASLTIGETTASTLTFSNGDMDHKRLIVTGNVMVGPNGNLTHSANTTTAAGDVHRIFLDVQGNLTIEDGGGINVNERGYARVQGPGRAVDSYTGAGHGGEGGNHGTRLIANTYGSLVTPINIGSGGWHTSRGGFGGGAVRLAVGGATVIDGSLTARGGDATGDMGGGGSGGSFYLVTGTLAGSGTISADGGDAAAVTTSGGGGGRISLNITNATDIGSVNLSVQGGAVLAGGGRPGGGGTIYLRFRDMDRGRLIVDNKGSFRERATRISSLVTDTDVGDVIVRNAGRLLIFDDQSLTVYGSWSNAATFAGNAGSTVEFAGLDPVNVWGNTTWQNLTIATAGKKVYFEAGATQTINGVPTFENVVWLLSTVPGSQWNLIKPGVAGEEQTVGAVVVQDSDARGGKTFVAGLGSASLGNNRNWTFPPRGSLMSVR